MDIENEQTPKAWPTGPEQIPPIPKPDIGSKRDLITPEQPEVEPPKKPIPDMDPDGQDPDENETV